MAPATIIFHCPQCLVRLNVPASLAGVSGPCPKCRVPITAPHESELAAVPSPPPERAIVPEGPKIRPEPRQLPDRGPAAPIAAKRTTEDDHFRPREVAYAARARRPGRVLHSLLPASFIAVAGVLVYLLLYFFLPDGPVRKLRDAQAPLVIAPRAGGAAVLSSPMPPPPPSPGGDGAELPRVDSVGLLDEISPAVAANNLLDAFLKAPDAASRVGMVEPEATVEELEATFLKVPLPEVSQIVYDLPRRNAAEGFSDYPYRVSFYEEGRRNTEFAVLVRQRPGQPPKVYLPAFLDLAGGRLAAFTRQPNTDEPANFHVILEPVIGCHEDGIPNAERKFTLKLLPSNFGKETARAYCANQSRFREMVERPDYPIRWGTRVPATVTLQWNHKEDPTMPYLELMDINSPDWNP